MEVKKIESGLRIEAILTSKQKMISAYIIWGQICYGYEYLPSTPTESFFVGEPFRLRRGVNIFDIHNQHSEGGHLLLVSLSSRLYFPSVDGAIELYCSLELQLRRSDFYISTLCKAFCSCPVLHFLIPQRYPTIPSKSLALPPGYPLSRSPVSCSFRKQHRRPS